MTATYATLTQIKDYIGQTEATTPFSAQQLQDSIDRAQVSIDNELITHFADGTVATPDYVQVTNEKHRGLGAFNRDYFLDYGPIPDFSATLTENAAIGATTITVDSTDGFPASGVFAIGSEKITYSAKDDTTFTVTATTKAHVIGDEVLHYIFEFSTDAAGNSPTWTVLTPGSQYDLDFKSGRVHLYDDCIILNYLSYTSPPRIPFRARFTYLYGAETIPLDITKLCVMIAAHDLKNTTLNKAFIGGLDDFKPAILNANLDTIEKIKQRYYYRVSDTI